MYDLRAVKQLLEDVSVVWLDNASIVKCGRIRRLRLAIWGLPRIIDRLGLPADLAAWTPADEAAFRLAL